MKIKGAVVIGGSPGLKDTVAREVRRAKDDSKAHSLVAYGLQLFMENWYAGDLWKRWFLGSFLSEGLTSVIAFTILNSLVTDHLLNFCLQTA